LRELFDMLRPRVIPVLLLRGDGLVKGVRFSNYKYVGDPLNAVKIFSDKEVDELLFLDITATQEQRAPALELVEKIADECYMPFGVGGGIRTIAQIRALLSGGAEKVAVNTAAVETPRLIQETAENFGSQSIVVSIDVKRNWRGAYQVYTRAGQKKTGLDPVGWAVEVERLGAGEILLNSIDQDGTMQGYDLRLVEMVSAAVNIPVIACGGAASVQHFVDAIHKAKASAVAAGSFFVFYGPKRAVLINVPTAKELQGLFDGE
jgi:imidazole glycerol-phosphate synthase subunit HisF